MSQTNLSVAPDKDLDFRTAASRRDVTINAMGKDAVTHDLLDPFGGQDDLSAGILRHVSEKLAEDPLCPLRVDPQRFVRLALHSLGVSAVRRYIGDPHVGPQLRRVVAELGSHDVEFVTRECARRLPNSHLGPSRVADALLTSARGDASVFRTTCASASLRRPFRALK